MSLPADLPHPSTFSDERLREILRAMAQQEADGTICDCNTCCEAAIEVRREVDRRGLTARHS